MLTKIAGLSDEDAAQSVTDGPDDKGIDAIAYVDSETPRLYVVQSKWSDTGTKGASAEDMMKITKGLSDLVSDKWDRFNDKVKARASELDDVLLKTNLRIEVIFASMGTPAVADNVREHMDDYLSAFNDPTELAVFTYANQGFIYKLLVDETQPSQIDLTIELSDWGRLQRAAQMRSTATSAEPRLRDGSATMATFSSRATFGWLLPNSEVNNLVLETITDNNLATLTIKELGTV